MIGGSASTAYALPSENLAWPKLLEKSLFGVKVNHFPQTTLTMGQSIEILSGISESDILILQIWTPVGWLNPIHSLASPFKLRTANRKVADEVRGIFSVATKKAPNVIWLQHQSLQPKRNVLERKVYERYYERLFKAIKENSSEKMRLVKLGEEFLVPENYLLDGLHLSEIGHERVADKLQRILSESY